MTTESRRNRSGAPLRNPYAVYVYCDASLTYDRKRTGGVGIHIEFPEWVGLDDVDRLIGRYEGANIERLEMEAIIAGLEAILELRATSENRLRNVRHLIVVTDRQRLDDQELTSRVRIRQWRHDGWLNFENKPIKNSDLLEKLDKTRAKVERLLYCRVEVEYQRRKFNKPADRLSRAAKQEPSANTSIALKGVRVGKRAYDGEEVHYSALMDRQRLVIRIFHKQPVRDEWEIHAEICAGTCLGRTITIYGDADAERQLHRAHHYEVSLGRVLRHHVTLAEICEVSGGES